MKLVSSMVFSVCLVLVSEHLLAQEGSVSPTVEPSEDLLEFLGSWDGQEDEWQEPLEILVFDDPLYATLQEEVDDE